MNNFLNDIEKAQITSFLGNLTMSEAVKKVLLFQIYHSEALKAGEPAPNDLHWVYGATQDPSLTDESVGRRVRVQVAALSLVENSFKELEKYKLVETKLTEDKTNKAR